MLPNFEITNFRTFKHLRIERLARVNLIMGKNNVGKTTLLEALRLYATPQPELVACQTMVDREECSRHWGHDPKPGNSVYHLFHGRQASGRDSSEIVMGPIHAPAAAMRIQSHPDDEHPMRSTVTFVRGEGRRRTLGRGRLDHFDEGNLLEIEESGAAFRSARGVAAATVSRWWDAIALRTNEDRLVESLQLLAPVERIHFMTRRKPGPDDDRVPTVRLKGEVQPVTLKSLGDGVVRMFEMALAAEVAACARDSRENGSPSEDDQTPQLLLIDEIENGIHHTLHAGVFRFLLRLARKEDLQVFATTHSWDCLKGFAEAVNEDEQNDGLAIRLEKLEGHEATRAVVFDRDELPIVIRDSIEVR